LLLEEVGRDLSEPPKDSPGAGPPFCVYFETDTELLGHDAAAVLIRVHADSRLVAESHRESIQQNDALPVASKQALIDLVNKRAMI
jgi:hypothetical protein